MSDFEKDGVNAPEEESTIFSAPAAHTEKVKKPARVKNILLSALALVMVAAITVTVFILVPEMEGEKAPEELTEIRLMDEKLFDKVTEAELTNENGNVKFYMDEVEVTVSDEVGYENKWLLSEVDKDLTALDEIEATMNSFKGLVYTKVISEDKNDGKDYGFAEPVYKLDFKGEDGFSLIIGARTPDRMGRYATTTKLDGVYYVDEMALIDFDKTELDFAIKESINPITEEDVSNPLYINNGALVGCDKLVIYNKNLGMEYTIEANTVDNVKTFSAFQITSPERRAAGDDGVSALINLFSGGFSPQGCYSFTTSDYDMKRFGLDNPDFYVTIYVDNVVKTIKASKQADGNYAVITSDTKTIIKVDAATMAPAAFTKKELCNTFLFMEGVITLDKITFASGGETLTFNLETSENEEKDKEVLEKAIFDGKELDVDNFKSFYQFLISMTPVSYEAANISGRSPDTVITLYHKDGSAPSYIKYYSAGAGRYVVENNGLVMGMISSSNHAYIMKYAKNTAADMPFNSK